MRLAALAAPAAASDYRLELIGTGLREYYCTATVRLTNEGDTPLAKISGDFLLYVGQQRVGRSKGTWFLNVAPGGSAEAAFETPNAPCDEVERYEYVVGACRLDASGFAAPEACIDRAALTAPPAAPPR